MKSFPDVSFYQGMIDWDQMRENTDSVIVRIGQGAWPDKQFKLNFSEAKKRGMLRGIYVFFDDRFSPTAHLEMIKMQLGEDLPELELFVDWENSYGGAFGGVKNVVALMEAIERAFPTVKVGMYTGYYWFMEHTHAVTNYWQLQYLKKKPLWLAWYTGNLTNVKIPRPWTSMWYWQWGTPTVDWGQESLEIDMNYYTAPEVTFYDRFTQTGDAMWEGKTNQVAKIWNSVGGQQIDELPKDTAVKGYAPQGDYVQLTSPVAGWTKKIWLTNYHEITTTPPDPEPEPEPEPGLPAYFTAHKADGTLLGYYDLRTS